MKKRENGLTFGFPWLILLFLLSGACVTTGSSVSDKDFERAQDLYDHGRYGEALAAFDSIVNSNAFQPADPLLARSYRLRGECHKKLKHYTLAKLDFDTACKHAQALGDRFPGGDRLSVECAMAKGDVLVHEGFTHTADQIYSDLSAGNPPTSIKDELLYRRYICARLLKKPDSYAILARMSDSKGFDSEALDREFLGLGFLKEPPRVVKPADPLATGNTGQYTLLSRSRWNAKPIRTNISRMTTIRKITVHHSGVHWSNSDFNSTAREIASFQKFHQNTKHWADIGYHFLIDYSGRIWEGRPLSYQGAHAGNEQLNRGNVGISLMGNFDEQRLNRNQADALASLIADLSSRYNLAPGSIVTHKELRSTDCPGRHLQRFVDQLRTGSL